jgi:acyl-coenzyme A thioesterase PaaI-like protein
MAGLASLGARLPRRWKRLFFRTMGLYPPFLGAGIRVARISEDLLTFEVRASLHFWNRNYVGTQFGGTLYAMCDPFFMLILIEALGPGYLVWDKAASIRFRRPGRGPVRAVFHVPVERVEEIRREADAAPRVEPVFRVNVVDEGGEVVAEVEKTLHVRRRDAPPSPRLSPRARAGGAGD